MSLLIKGMDMPKCCDDCTFYQDDVYPACKFLWDDFDNYRHPAIVRDKNCPLSEISAPHGRLIDADRLEDRIKNMVGKYDTAIPLNVVYRLIADAHPVIEAEE